jgi:hypothetical protein
VTIDQLGSIGEFVASIATLATLVYLAFQIRQNTALARAQSIREISNFYPINHALAARPDLIDINRRGHHNFLALSKDEQASFHHINAPLLNQFEAAFRMHRQGLIDEDLYQSWRSIILSIVSTPGAKQWWPMARIVLSSDCAAELDRALANDSDAIVPLNRAWPFYTPDT